MRILVVATAEELTLAMKIFPKSVFNMIVVTGVGPTNVIQALDHIDREAEIINVGYAGSNNLPIGTHCRIGTTSCFHVNCEYDEEIFNLKHGDIHCYTGCDFVTKAPQQDCVFDMELAFIAALGFTNIDAVKVVSDNLDYNQYENTINND